MTKTTPRLVGSVLALISLVACGGGSSSPTDPAGLAETATATEATLEQQTYAKVNDYRTAKGLVTLTWRDVIADQARQHSRNMATGATAFGHDGFNTRTNVIAQTIAFTSAAENVGTSSRSLDQVTSVVNNWLSDAAHRANIEGSFNLTGVGVAEASNGVVYFTQLFIRSR